MLIFYLCAADDLSEELKCKNIPQENYCGVYCQYTANRKKSKNWSKRKPTEKEIAERFKLKFLAQDPRIDAFVEEE